MSWDLFNAWWLGPRQTIPPPPEKSSPQGIQPNYCDWRHQRSWGPIPLSAGSRAIRTRSLLLSTHNTPRWPAPRDFSHRSFVRGVTISWAQGYWPYVLKVGRAHKTTSTKRWPNWPKQWVFCLPDWRTVRPFSNRQVLEVGRSSQYRGPKGKLPHILG